MQSHGVCSAMWYMYRGRWMDECEKGWQRIGVEMRERKREIGGGGEYL